MLPTANSTAAPVAPQAPGAFAAGTVGWLPVEVVHTSYARLRPGVLCIRPDQAAELPIRVAPIDDGAYEVLDGFKRLARWREGGHHQVPVVVEPPGTAPVHKRRLLVANCPPRTTTPLDEAEVVRSLIDDDGFTPAGVAHFLGHRAKWVACREAIARRLGPEGRRHLAAGRIGTRVAHALCALPTRDQDALVTAVVRHGLGAGDAVVVVDAYRVADPTDRRALLASPMDAVRPQAPPPTLTPRAVALERRLVGFAEALRELRNFTLPDDLAPAERRRLEAVHRSVLAELATTASTLGVAAPTPSPPAKEQDDVRPDTPDTARPTAPAGTPTHSTARPGHAGRDHSPARPRPGHPEDPGRPGRLATARDSGPGRGGTVDPGGGPGGLQAPALPRRDRKAGGTGPDDLAHPARDPGNGLPGWTDDPGRACATTPGRSGPRAQEDGQAPLRDRPRRGDAD